jgi:hypothetical protein
MKKTTSGKSSKKNVKAVKRGKPKAAKPKDNKDNKEVISDVPVNPVISENIIIAASIEEAVEKSILNRLKNIEYTDKENVQIEDKENIQIKATENTENKTLGHYVENAYPYDTTQRDSVSYADIRMPEIKDYTSFYIGLLGGILMLTWMFFL